MSTIRKKVASALSFAHLTGFAKAAEPDDDKTRPDDNAEGDDPEKKDQDHEDGNVKKGKKATSAEDDKDDESAEDDAPDEKDDDKKAKGSKADDDPDAEDDEDEMRGKSAAASARRRERARCAAIFSSKAAGKNPALAANLAFNTSMTRKEALTVLESTPAATSAYGDRSARNPGIAAGAVRPSGKQAVSNSWDAAFKKVAPRR